MLPSMWLTALINEPFGQCGRYTVLECNREIKLSDVGFHRSQLNKKCSVNNLRGLS